MSWRIGEASYEATAQALGDGRFRVTCGGSVVSVGARLLSDGALVLTMPDGTLVRSVISRSGDDRYVSADGRTLRARLVTQRSAGQAELGLGLEAPMPGKVTRLLVAVGDVVKQGQTLVTVEAMKMEHALKAPRNGVVSEVRAKAGQFVEPGRPLVVLDEP